MLGGKIRETEVEGGARMILEVRQLVLAMVKWGRSEGIPRWEFSSERKERGQGDEPQEYAVEAGDECIIS